MHSCFNIYESPEDYPGKFVVRRFSLLPGGPRSTNEIRVCSTLEEARGYVPPYASARFPRAESDMPSFVEMWL